MDKGPIINIHKYKPPGNFKAGGILMLVILGLLNRFDSIYVISEDIEFRTILLQVVERIGPLENRYRQ